jgi:LacI family transcriptional regulator
MKSMNQLPVQASPAVMRRIAVVAPFGEEFVSRIINGVLGLQQERSDLQVRDFLFTFSVEDISELPALTRVWGIPWHAWRPDGIIALVHPIPALWDWISATKVPIVNTINHTPFPTVAVGLTDLTQKSVEFLQSLSVQSMAYVGTSEQDSRLDETRKQAAAHKIARFRSVNIGNTPMLLDASGEMRVAEHPLLLELLKSCEKPLGVIASNDRVARKVCLCCEKLGLRIPTDVAVLGSGNFAVGRTSSPPLSTIDIPGEAVGRRAAELLLEAIDGKSIPLRTEVPAGELIVRQSTGGQVTEVDQDLLHARHLIRTRACQGLSVQELADELNISISTLRRRFEQAGLNSPSDEIANARANRANELLRTTSMPISQIARLTGFTTCSRFSQAFRQRRGETPRAYRSRFRSPTAQSVDALSAS